MEEDNAKGGAADEADAEEKEAGVAEQMVSVEQNDAVVNAVDQEVAENVIG
ncbi:unnamed protein product [Prunus armeniaca]